MITSSECLKKFGDPTNPKNEANYMVLFDVPTHLEIGVIPKKIYCNKLLVQPLLDAFENLIDRKFVNELRTWDGCFNIRKKRGLNSLSLHSWGLAIDVNAAWNQLGKVGTLSNGFGKCFTDAGFYWGKNFKRLDYMHFELETLK